MPGFLSRRPNGVPSHTQASFAPPPPHWVQGGDTLACGEGVGDPIPTQGQTLWYSMYTKIPLRSVRTTEQVRNERLWGFPLTTKGSTI